MVASCLFLPQQTAPPTDPRIRNVSSADQQSKICRNYVWGICTKGKQCKFRHELDVEAMKTILKFCHDYQNRTGCTRPDCTYLHSTREEQDLFLTTGEIPHALVERHAKMSSSPLDMYMSEYIAQAPPPHPPPPPPSTTALPPPLPAALPTLLAPPPPPPPLPTTSTTPVQVTAPISSAPPPFGTSAIFTVAQPPPLTSVFNASRPPPPIPSNSDCHKSGSMKRVVPELSNAGPSKARKVESAKVVDSLCENCVQRELRIELYRQEMQKLECEKEYQTYIYEKKCEEYDNGRLLLKSIANPDLFRILDEYIEGSSQLVQVNDVLAQFHQTSSFVSGTSTVPRQFLLQLMDCVFSNPRSVVDATHIHSVGVDEPSILHSLTSLTRRPNPISHTSSDVLQAVLEVIRNSTSLNTDNISSALHIPNAPHPSSASHTPSALHPHVVSRPAVAHPPASAHFSSVSHTSNAPQTSSVRAVSLQPTCWPYQPAVPSPTKRPYCPQTLTTTTNYAQNLNSPYPNTLVRAGVTPQVSALPSTSVTASPAQIAQNYNPYIMGRYPPQPHYYPSFQ